MVAGPILNLTARGLSAGAKVILKQLKTLMKKPKKTTADRKKITKLKKELNADKTVKEKQDKKYIDTIANTVSKAQKLNVEKGLRARGETDKKYIDTISKAVSKAQKLNVKKGLTANKPNMSTGGLSSKKYANPVKFVNNLNK
tara:strand:- start:51 stop:479 length:429 start_codon:yes stop_codon:yes gene_type:complete